ncbi:MAG: hypothetical protein MRZ63_10960 [Anaerostipes sp.]|uniref:hypothetical protein n=1 Tax=Anaerostipes sp. 992a TaxID=1261637 RepID=UPI0013014F80|nr:hypothetical protein [Anaerostipes sp. 992a]MCI5952806.1 hypothetical protein [Anaerostipes sp.]MDD5968446.1 hypothetical protein [Anaerostipes sp.]
MDLVIVSTAVPSTYFFAVALEVAVLPDLVADELVIFQLELGHVVVTVDLVHLEETPFT